VWGAGAEFRMKVLEEPKFALLGDPAETKLCNVGNATKGDDAAEGALPGGIEFIGWDGL